MSLIKSKLIILFFLATFFASTVRSKNIKDMCENYNASEFTIFGTKEKVTFDIALTTKVKDYVFSFERLRLDSPTVAKSLVTIDRSRTLKTSEGSFKVLVSSSFRSPQLQLDIEVSQKLSGKPFVPKFFGCQIDNKNSVVYHVSEDLSQCIDLSLAENRRLFREMPKLARLTFYLRLFEAIAEFNQAGFIHSNLDTYTITQCTREDGSVQPVINELGYAQKLNEPLDLRPTAKHWFPTEKQFGKKANSQVDLFEAAVFVIDVEYDSKDDIFESFPAMELDLFSYKFNKNKEGYLKLAALALENSEYGRVDPLAISKYELSTFSALVVAILNYDLRVANESKVLELMSKIVKNEEKVAAVYVKGKYGRPEKQAVIQPRLIEEDSLDHTGHEHQIEDQNMII